MKKFQNLNKKVLFKINIIFLFLLIGDEKKKNLRKLSIQLNSFYQSLNITQDNIDENIDERKSTEEKKYIKESKFNKNEVAVAKIELVEKNSKFAKENKIKIEEQSKQIKQKNIDNNPTKKSEINKLTRFKSETEKKKKGEKKDRKFKDYRDNKDNKDTRDFFRENKDIGESRDGKDKNNIFSNINAIMENLEKDQKENSSGSENDLETIKQIRHRNPPKTTLVPFFMSKNNLI